MKPAGPLMIEHRLIERMVALLGHALDQMREVEQANVHLIATGVDFFRMYADRTHHGKEEDILFRQLQDKSLSREHEEMMQRLVQEHIWAREAVGKLSSANQRYQQADKGALPTMMYELGKIVEFYPAHIEKEDKHFFLPVMEYFSESEQQAMLDAFWDFDRKMIHEKYEGVVEEAERLKEALDD
jgi:hemerythrin-like domain-containing protein